MIEEQLRKETQILRVRLQIHHDGEIFQIKISHRDNYSIFNRPCSSFRQSQRRIYYPFDRSHSRADASDDISSVEVIPLDSISICLF